MSEEGPLSPPVDSDRDLAAALHEVGNGLTVILGWLQEAQARAEGRQEGEVAEAVQIALDRTLRAHRIARRAIGADPTKASVEPLASLVLECTRGLGPEAAKKRIEMVTRLDADVERSTIEAGDRLLQVITNLLMNALEVTPQGGAITLDARRGDDPGCIVVTVADGGPGIPERERSRLFQRGQSGRAGGAGIGLAHAMRMTTEEGGRLSVAPYEPGHGAVFELVWPVSAASSRGGPHTRRAAMLSECRVAVVDDDTGVVELLDMVLSARGATVQSFAKHADFILALAETSFDVALLDASPYGDTLETSLVALRTSHPHLGLVLISGSSDPGVSVGKLGVTWIRKPFEIGEVIDVVRVVRATSQSGT